jgi:hypothetical protein
MHQISICKTLCVLRSGWKISAWNVHFQYMSSVIICCTTDDCLENGRALPSSLRFTRLLYESCQFTTYLSYMTSSVLGCATNPKGPVVDIKVFCSCWCFHTFLSKHWVWVCCWMLNLIQTCSAWMYRFISCFGFHCKPPSMNSATFSVACTQNFEQFCSSMFHLTPKNVGCKMCQNLLSPNRYWLENYLFSALTIIMPPGCKLWCTHSSAEASVLHQVHIGIDCIRVSQLKQTCIPVSKW